MNNLQQFVADSIMGNGALYQDSQIYPQEVSVVKMLPLPEGSLKMVQKFNTALTLHCIHDLQSVSQSHLKFKTQPYKSQDSKYMYKYIFWIKTIFLSLKLQVFEVLMFVSPPLFLYTTFLVFFSINIFHENEVSETTVLENLYILLSIVGYLYLIPKVFECIMISNYRKYVFIELWKSFSLC